MDAASVTVSLPSLGAWIETLIRQDRSANAMSRSLHWERGLKHIPASRIVVKRGRSLHWERGLKL